jgi:hypothetical protein
LDLVEAYVAKGDITYGTWTDLVTAKWNRAIEHSGDIFGALNLLTVRQRQTYVLWGLDALALCRVMLTDDESYFRAHQYILGTLIILYDGDIFLNCIAAEGDFVRLRDLLTKMIQFKRQRLFSIYKLAEIRKQIARIINIDTQPTNRGGASAGKGLSSGRRTATLTEQGGPLTAELDLTVKISDDYFRKVPPKRRDWAISLGFLDVAGQLNDRGKRLLGALRTAGLETDGGAYAIWPLAYELTQLNIVPSSVAEHPLNTWTFSALTMAAFGSDDSGAAPNDVENEVIGEMRELFRGYRSLNPTRAPLRSELPIPVAYLAYSGLCVAANRPRRDVPGVIEQQRTGQRRVLDYRSSKRMEGAILFKG